VPKDLEREERDLIKRLAGVSVVAAGGGEGAAPRREEAFLATKIFPVLPLGSVVGWRARASARRLRTDRLDLYQLHWPSPHVPLASTMAGMRRLTERGLVRHVGVSNYSLERWQAAEAALGAPVLSNQVQFSLVHRSPQFDLVPYAQGQGRVVIAYSPLAQGLSRAGTTGSTARPAGSAGSTPCSPRTAWSERSGWPTSSRRWAGPIVRRPPRWAWPG